jgi:hypothetical protein
VLRRLREHGPGWVARRSLFELRVPSTAPGRAVRNTLARIEDAARRWRTGAGVRHAEVEHTLYAFYDLEVLPATYDIATFLALAELERRRRALARIHVVIVPPREAARSEGLAADTMPAEARDQRVLGILLPVLRLSASCRGQTVCATRAEAAAWRFHVARHVFPADYSPSFPTSPDFSAIRRPQLTSAAVFPLLRAQPRERSAMAAALRGRIGDRAAVVISLREQGSNAARNSRTAEWVAFADGLDAARFAAVFVRDTERALEAPAQGLERHVVLDAASYNAGLRMAVYELAYVNLAIMHGAMELCWFNEACRYVAFMPVGTSPQTTPEFLAARGFREGQSLPFARPWQRLCWLPDEHANIDVAFAEMRRVIDGAVAS